MSCCKDKCAKACCSGGKMKIKIPQAKTVAMNSNVAAQAITTTSTTVLLLTPGPFSFSSFNNCNRCCGSYNSNVNNLVNVCTSGVFLITVLVNVDTAPDTQAVTLALDLNSSQFLIQTLTGSGTSLAFTTTANLCGTDTVKFRIYATSGYLGNVTSGNVSVTKIAERVNSCC